MPVVTSFGKEEGKDGQGVRWIDIDVADPQERAWLSAWPEIAESTRAMLLEPVRLSHRDHLPDGMFLSLRAMGASDADALSGLTDLKLLIGRTMVVTARLGEVAAVDELRQYVRSGRSLVTAVDLLAFMVSGMTKRMEAIIFDLARDTDTIEDESLDNGSKPSPQAINALRRRVLRSRRQLTSVQQVLAPIATDPALVLDSDDRETLVRSSNHVTRYLEAVEDCRARIQILEDQIEAQRTTTMTRASLNLTIVATVFLPLTFISGLLGMNVAGIPEEHNPWGFWIVSGLSILVALLAWLLLHRRMRQAD